MICITTHGILVIYLSYGIILQKVYTILKSVLQDTWFIIKEPLPYGFTCNVYKDKVLLKILLLCKPTYLGYVGN